MVWQTILINLALALVSHALRPRPSNAGITPGQIEVPGTESGKTLRVIFGSRWVTPDVVWYGDGKTAPVRTEGGK